MDGSKVLREYHITAGKIQTDNGRAKPLIADYVLVYQGRKLAIVEAKSDEQQVGEGVAQAKDYAGKLKLDYTFSSNGKEIYQICMKTGEEGLIASFPTPDELWKKTFATQNKWRDTFNNVPFEDVGGTMTAHYYQEIAVNNTMAAIAEDTVIEGEVEEGKIYEEADFNRIIEIKEREAKRVQILLSEIDQSEKAIVFCATQNHAAAVLDLINQYKKSKEPNYCVRVTANDGALGEQYLREFQDHEKSIPTILTTSQKLSTGVNARNIRNIVLMRPVNSMIEFKQIINAFSIF